MVKKGARVVLLSHLGDGTESLAPVVWYMKKKFPQILHTEDVVGESVISDVESMKNGDVLLLGNVRKEIGETENNKVFALALAGLADIYVNDALRYLIVSMRLSHFFQNFFLHMLGYS